MIGARISLYTILAGLIFAAAFLVAQAITVSPSAFCHETDGVFTVCPDGNQEWSDVASTGFTESGAFLYADQADKDPLKSIPNGSGIDTLMLMYDETQRTIPLFPSETVDVHFMTVDELQLLHYDVKIGTAGLVEVKINGVVQDPMPSGVAGIAGFGSSPNNPTPHVMAEFQIGLEAAGFTNRECCYSSDPAWWGSSVPPNPVGECIPTQLTRFSFLRTNQLDQGTNQFDRGEEDTVTGDCQLQPTESATAAVFTANLSGTTAVEPQPLLPVGEEPPLCETIGRIVDFRVPTTAIYRNHGAYVKQVAQLTEALVQSQVAAGLITAEEGTQLQSCVVNPRARSNVGK